MKISRFKLITLLVGTFLLIFFLLTISAVKGSDTANDTTLQYAIPTETPEQFRLSELERKLIGIKHQVYDCQIAIAMFELELRMHKAKNKKEAEPQ